MADIHKILGKLETERVRAAEDAVISSIPADMLARLKQAQEEHRAKGGCPGCGSMVFAVHNIPCSIADGDLY